MKVIVFALLVAIVLPGMAQQSLTKDQRRKYETITVDGISRTYLLNLPPSYDGASVYALVIAMHGGGGTAEQFERTSKLTSKANAAGFIVVYPEGVKSTGPLGLRTWNAGACCGYARDNGIDDVKFITHLVDKLVNAYKIDPKKVYATGHSNGGMLAYRLACEVPERITAIAVSGCSMVFKGACSAARPVPVLHMHSLRDSRVSPLGGVGITEVYYPPVDSVLNAWATRNGCRATGIAIDNKDYKVTKWSDCNGSVTIQYYLTKDGGHAWPGGLPGRRGADTPSKAINANELLWEFFQQYAMK